MKSLVLWFIRLYQLCISPFLGVRCRYVPSCSLYAEQAIEKYGFLKGSWLVAHRLLRCHPWGGQGEDPLP